MTMRKYTGAWMCGAIVLCYLSTLILYGVTYQPKDLLSEVTALRSQVEALQKSTDECAAGVRYFGRLEELTRDIP